MSSRWLIGPVAKDLPVVELRTRACCTSRCSLRSYQIADLVGWEPLDPLQLQVDRACALRISHLWARHGREVRLEPCPDAIRRRDVWPSGTGLLRGATVPSIGSRRPRPNSRRARKVGEGLAADLHARRPARKPLTRTAGLEEGLHLHERGLARAATRMNVWKWLYLPRCSTMSATTRAVRCQREAGLESCAPSPNAMLSIRLETLAEQQT